MTIKLFKTKFVSLIILLTINFPIWADAGLKLTDKGLESIPMGSLLANIPNTWPGAEAEWQEVVNGTFGWSIHAPGLPQIQITSPQANTPEIQYVGPSDKWPEHAVDMLWTFSPEISFYNILSPGDYLESINNDQTKQFLGKPNVYVHWEVESRLWLTFDNWPNVFFLLNPISKAEFSKYVSPDNKRGEYWQGNKYSPNWQVQAIMIRVLLY